MKVIFATPSLGGPTSPYIKSLEDSLKLIVDAGWEEGYVQEIGNPYISAARATMTRKAIDAKADVIVYIDYDLSWKPEDLLKLIETPGDVVAGVYRYKKETVEYMGNFVAGDDGRPVVREDGCIKASHVPGGFLKVTVGALRHFAKFHPHLLYGDPLNPSIDLFNHGAVDGMWWGEDYAFCRRWTEAGGDIWVVPNMDLNHHAGETVFEGNFHKHLLGLPGGSNFEGESDNGN